MVKCLGIMSDENPCCLDEVTVGGKIKGHLENPSQPSIEIDMYLSYCSFHHSLIWSFKVSIFYFILLGLFLSGFCNLEIKQRGKGTGGLRKILSLETTVLKLRQY